jgi:hypothetical protein
MKSLTLGKWGILLLLILFPLSLLAQTAGPAPIPPVARPGVHIRQEPCWQEAGVSKAAMEQRRSIERSSKAQIESVCADSALTAQQKHEKIREIRERTRQQMQALVSPQQQEAIRSCQETRGGGRRVGGGVHRVGERPCGEMPTPAPSPAKPEPPSSPPTNP